MTDRIAALQRAAREEWDVVVKRLAEGEIYVQPWADSNNLTPHRWALEWALKSKWALEPEAYKDRNWVTPEEEIREKVQSLLAVIVQECQAATTSTFYCRQPPMVKIRAGDDFGNWLCLVMKGAPSPIMTSLSNRIGGLWVPGS